MTQTWQEDTLNDDANADRFVRDHGENVAYLAERREWLVWDDRSGWVPDPGGLRVRELAMQTARGIASEAAEEARAGRDTKAQALWGWCRQSRSAARIDAMLKVARGRVSRSVTEYDRDGTLLAFTNGVVDLRSGEFRPYTRDDLITRRIPFDYDPDATCPLWEHTLAEVLPDDEIRDYVRRAFGYAATGEVREHIIHILFGPGRNGKGVTVGTVQELLGPYHAALSDSILMARDPDKIKGKLAQLDGVRFAATDELPKASQLNLSILKRLSSGDAVDVEAKYENNRTAWLVAKYWICTNHRPTIPPSEAAMWARVRLVPFEQSFYGREDTTLKERLREEFPGIAVWLVRAARDYYADGLAAPASVMAATTGYRDDMDLIGRFLRDEGEFMDSSATTKQVTARFAEWRHDYGIADDLPESEIVAALRAHGWDNRRKSRAHGRVARYWRPVAAVAAVAANPENSLTREEISTGLSETAATPATRQHRSGRTFGDYMRHANNNEKERT